MTRRLLLVDYENVPKIDLSDLDESYRAIVFLGAKQNPPRASRRPTTAHRFRRVEFLQIVRSGKNALDFHIAFHLGRIYETAKDTSCIIISADTGFDALVEFLNAEGLHCLRIASFEELRAQVLTVSVPGTPAEVICRRCKEVCTLELHGGRWCKQCGRFASPPDPALLPSNQPGYVEAIAREIRFPTLAAVCAWCLQTADMSDGIYDDGEWMCAGCIAGYIN